MSNVTVIPLSIYVHIPWCVRKCPYCDFNSHAFALHEKLPEQQYIAALFADLERDLPRVWGRRVSSIFIGGGTPSLFSPQAIDELLCGLRARLALSPFAEITMEANPGTVESGRFREFYAAGINRLSIGVQSFNDKQLRRLGRIHDGVEAVRAVQIAQDAGFENINLDLMFGLPQQALADAIKDIEQAIALQPAHISYYQLTLEPNTYFFRFPPSLPDDEAVWRMQNAGVARLKKAGFGQYEISAYGRPGKQCRHNINYWTFGDYLGIGAGAHGKLSVDVENNISIRRMWKLKHPRAYLQHAGRPEGVGGERAIVQDELGLEFMMNALRLTDKVPLSLFYERTGLPLSALQPGLGQAVAKKLLCLTPAYLQTTALGQRFLNDLLQCFLPADSPSLSKN